MDTRGQLEFESRRGKGPGGYSVSFANSSQDLTVTEALLWAVLPPEMIVVSANDGGREKTGVITWGNRQDHYRAPVRK